MVERTLKQPIALNARTAADMMTHEPLAVHDTDPVRVAAELLVRFSAVPVIDGERHIVGILSRTDLVKAHKLVHGDGEANPALEIPPPYEDGEPSGINYRPPVRIRQVMNPSFIAVGLDTKAASIIRMMVERKIGRVFVLDDHDRLVGVVSSFDVLTRLDL